MPTFMSYAQLEQRLVKFEPIRDAMRRYLTDNLTAQKLSGYWKQIDSGSLDVMVEMAEEIEAKEARIYRLASRRREGITELEWEVTPPPDDELPDGSTPEAAKTVADAVTKRLKALRSFDTTLEHNTTGITSGIAATELVWRRGQLVDTVDVPANRLNQILWNDPSVRIRHDDDWTGTPATYGKFIVNCPSQRAWNKTRVVLPRAASVLYLAKHFALTDWLAFAEVFGMPWRIARIDDPENDESRKQVERMLKTMAGDAYGVLPKSVELEFMEAGRGTQPFAELIEMIHAEMSILYLGQTLTTEQGDRGAFALGKVHANVEAAITLSDVRKEGRVLRDQLLRPMVAMMFPGKNAPVPHWKRKLVESQNLEAARLRMDQLRYADEKGFAVDVTTRAEVLGMPVPEKETGPKLLEE